MIKLRIRKFVNVKFFIETKGHVSHIHRDCHDLFIVDTCCTGSVRNTINRILFLGQNHNNISIVLCQTAYHMSNG